MKAANLFTTTAATLPEERFESLVETNAFKLERIVSTGHATPAGQWYDQERDEWIVLLSGTAGLLFEDEPEPVRLLPGDYILIPAHRRHRVEWPDGAAPTIWLALHYRET